MAEYLLDSNHASPLVTLSHPLRDIILTRLAQGDRFALCVPVIVETIFGIGILPRAEQNRAEWKRLAPLVPCYIPDVDDAESAADLQIALRQQGRQLATVDALIATLALRYDLILLTTDRDFLFIPSLRQENWIDALLPDRLQR